MPLLVTLNGILAETGDVMGATACHRYLAMLFSKILDKLALYWDKWVVEYSHCLVIQYIVPFGWM